MRLFSTIILVLGLTGTTVARDRIERDFDVAKAGTLDIELVTGGRIEIEAWDKNSVAVEADLRSCDADDFNYDIEQRGNDVEVYFRLKRKIRSADLDVKVMVPREYNVELETAGGEVIISGVNGRMRGSTGGGDLELDGLKGELDLVTGGGTIILMNSEVDGDVRTGGGKVRVENVVGDFTASSGGGNVTYRNVKTPDREYPEDMVYLRNAGGNLKVNSAPAGAELTTGGGDIDVRSAVEFVIASTGGGDITVDRVDGWIEAVTGAGDIEVTMVGDPAVGRRDVELSTGTGDVILTIPRGLSADFDIELSYTKRAWGGSRIKSDIDLEIEETDRWTRDGGSSYKTIYGTASLNGGKNKIRIRATNGDVIIREEN